MTPQKTPPKFFFNSLSIVACSAWVWLIVLLGGCAQTGIDPCQQMMQEVKEVRSLEKQLAKTDTRIKKYRTENDTADLNEALRLQMDLRERHKAARLAAANMGASCLPQQPGAPDEQEPPLDPRDTGLKGAP